MRTYLFYVRTNNRNPITPTLDRVVLPGGKECFLRTVMSETPKDQLDPFGDPLPDEQLIGMVEL